MSRMIWQRSLSSRLAVHSSSDFDAAASPSSMTHWGASHRWPSGPRSSWDAAPGMCCCAAWTTCPWCKTLWDVCWRARGFFKIVTPAINTLLHLVFQTQIIGKEKIKLNTLGNKRPRRTEHRGSRTFQTSSHPHQVFCIYKKYTFSAWY